MSLKWLEELKCVCVCAYHRSPSLTFVQAAATDDVRVAVKDKERRGYGLPKPSPRHSFGPATPMPSPGVNNSGDWKAMYTTDGGADAAAGPVVSNAKARARELLMDLDHSSSSEDQVWTHTHTHTHTVLHRLVSPHVKCPAVWGLCKELVEGCRAAA